MFFFLDKYCQQKMFSHCYYIKKFCQNNKYCCVCTYSIQSPLFTIGNKVVSCTLCRMRRTVLTNSNLISSKLTPRTHWMAKADTNIFYTVDYIL